MHYRNSKTAVILAAALLLAALAVQSAHAAMVEMDDGRIIEGEIVGYRGGNLIVSTDHGAVGIPQTRVRNVRASGRGSETARSLTDEPIPEGEEYRRRVDDLGQELMGDQEIMGLMEDLRDDPEMQAVLEDPAIMRAVQEGDLATLLANPKFLRLLENAKVGQIQQRVREHHNK